MAIVQWSPLRDIASVQREMNQLLDSLMPDLQGSGGISSDFMPAAELRELPDAIELRVELPGLNAQDLDVQVTAEAVAISGERKAEARTEEKGVLRSEFRYGKFQRVIGLPARVQNDKVSAQYKDGILCLNLPKADAEKNRVVKVNLG